MGKKNDQDLYEKVDYSLIPLDLISLNPAPAEWGLFTMIHDQLNGKTPVTRNLLKYALEHYGLKPLSVALGVGVVKYGRDNWKTFDSDPDRFLRAALRHLMAIMTGATHDGEVIEGYPKGNDHRGAVCFNLMLAEYVMTATEIINKSKINEPLGYGCAHHIPALKSSGYFCKFQSGLCTKRNCPLK